MIDSALLAVHIQQLIVSGTLASANFAGHNNCDLIVFFSICSTLFILDDLLKILDLRESRLNSIEEGTLLASVELFGGTLN